MVLAVVFVSLTGALIYLVAQPAFAVFGTLLAAPLVLLGLMARFLESTRSDLDDWFAAKASPLRRWLLVAVIVTLVGFAAWVLTT